MPWLQLFFATVSLNLRSSFPCVLCSLWSLLLWSLSLRNMVQRLHVALHSRSKAPCRMGYVSTFRYRHCLSRLRSFITTSRLTRGRSGVQCGSGTSLLRRFSELIVTCFASYQSHLALLISAIFVSRSQMVVPTTLCALRLRRTLQPG